MRHRRAVIAIVAIAFATLLLLNFYFYLYVNAQNQNIVYNMRARALYSYAESTISIQESFKEYLATKNLDVIIHDARLSSYAAWMAAEACIQGSDKELYIQLWSTAHWLWDYCESPGGANETKMQLVISSLEIIGQSFPHERFPINIDPAESLGTNETATIINHCQIARANLEIFG